MEQLKRESIFANIRNEEVRIEDQWYTLKADDLGKVIELRRNGDTVLAVISDHERWNDLPERALVMNPDHKVIGAVGYDYGTMLAALEVSLSDATEMRTQQVSIIAHNGLIRSGKGSKEREETLRLKEQSVYVMPRTGMHPSEIRKFLTKEVLKGLMQFSQSAGLQLQQYY